MKNNKFFIVLMLCAALTVVIGIYYKGENLQMIGVQRELSLDQEKALIFAGYVTAVNESKAGNVAAHAGVERIVAEAHELGISDEELEIALELYTAQ